MRRERLSCPGGSLPADASFDEHAEACRGCTIADCEDRRSIGGRSTRAVRAVAFSGLFFAFAAAVLLLLKMI